MSVDYTKDILPLEQEGKTDAEIVSILSTLHRRDCMATGEPNPGAKPDILHILAAQMRVLRLGSDATWKGPLVDYMNALDTQVPQNAQLVAGFEMLLTQLQITGRVVYTSSDLEIAGLTNALTAIVGGLVDADPNNPKTSTDVLASINKATGGIVWAEANEAEIATMRQAYLDQQARIAAYADIQRRTGAALSAAEAALHNQESPAEIEASAQAAWQS